MQQQCCWTKWKIKQTSNVEINTGCIPYGLIVTNQMATLRITVEQSFKWKSLPYINFLDYEKSFDSMDMRSLWNFLRHHGVPATIVNITRSSWDGLHCKVAHRGQVTCISSMDQCQTRMLALVLWLTILWKPLHLRESTEYNEQLKCT